MTQQPKTPRVVLGEPDDRIQRLINLTARLVDKMLCQELQAQTHKERQTDEQ